ncbi:MAG: DUF2390 domain-containing protein [Pseudomonadota bacterium]|nr:DUF2390 domain-containing protein [Pseudomonadota bacterium]
MTKGDETLGSNLLEVFWGWAVAQYEDEQVREGLLELQESSNLIILEAMFLAWLGHRGQAIGEEDQQRIRAAVTPWVEGVVLPLRRQRQAWTGIPSMITNRRHLLGLELEAERVLAGLLVDALLIKEQLNDVSTPVVERNLSQLPELKDVVTRRRLVDMFGR